MLISVIKVDLNFVEPIFNLKVLALIVLPPTINVKHLPLSLISPFSKLVKVETLTPIFLKVFKISFLEKVADHE